MNSVSLPSGPSGSPGRALLGIAAAGLLGLLMFSPTLLLHYQIQTPEAEAEEDTTPPIWPLPDDETALRKAQLINLLLPAIQANNRELLALRAEAEAIHQRFRARRLTAQDFDWLVAQARRYRLEPPATPATLTEDWFATLLRRIDIVPASLALAQGAIESAWGTSRFAEEGNNYFGQWCFTPGCGMVPARRPAGARYEVQLFDTPEDAVRAYMLNLNSHPRYRHLRLLREQARAQEKPISGHTLAAGLEGYAEIGDEYISRLRAVMRSNDFRRFESF